MPPDRLKRQLKFVQAISEAIDVCMAKDSSVYIMGLGVPDPKGVWGTTLGLKEKYGSARVLDMPTAENGMTGVAIGSALAGMRPIMVHQRIDFALLAIEQIVNQAAKWHYMFGGQKSVPIVIRLVIGRGWGQGPQHSQSLQAWFAHVPGLKVLMPVTPYDAKGLLIASVEDNNPVIFIEHRWLHSTFGYVPEGLYRVPIGTARVAREGDDITIVATSYMVLEALRAAECLSQVGVSVEVIDIRSLKPLDTETILESVKKTSHLIVADMGWKSVGFTSEVVATVSEHVFDVLKKAPRRIALPDVPTPTTPALSGYYYPGAVDIVNVACDMLGVQHPDMSTQEGTRKVPYDVPDPSFMGPF